MARRVRSRDEPRRFDAEGFEPVDPGGLEIARPVLEPDVDEVARCQHLRRRLEIAALVAIEGRQRDPTRQQYEEGECGEQRDATRTRGERPAQSSVTAVGRVVRVRSQTTPTKSQTPTKARWRLLYFDWPAIRGR